MKIVITESQYSALIRRFSLSNIEDVFWYYVTNNNACEYKSFDDFFNSVSYRTEDTILYRILENDRNLKLDLEQSNKFRKIIQDFIYNNFSEIVEIKYYKYRKLMCPRKNENNNN